MRACKLCPGEAAFFLLSCRSSPASEDRGNGWDEVAWLVAGVLAPPCDGLAWGCCAVTEPGWGAGQYGVDLFEPRFDAALKVGAVRALFGQETRVNTDRRATQASTGNTVVAMYFVRWRNGAGRGFLVGLAQVTHQ